MNALRIVLSLLFIIVVYCCSSDQEEVTFKRTYGKKPEEESVVVYKYPDSGKTLLFMNSASGASQQRTLCCNLNEEYRIMLTDLGNNGWSTGSTLTVSYKNGILFDRVYLASGKYAELSFTLLQKDTKEVSWAYYVIGAVAIIIVIVIIIICCKNCC